MVNNDLSSWKNVLVTLLQGVTFFVKIVHELISQIHTFSHVCQNFRSMRLGIRNYLVGMSLNSLTLLIIMCSPFQAVVSSQLRMYGLLILQRSAIFSVLKY